MSIVVLIPSTGLHHLHRWAISPSSDHPGLTMLSTSMGARSRFRGAEGLECLELEG
ncbi:hypothetical protein P692DRAFT_201795382 [Suillus brevipes Sb2]|nr:hypothetical protein P692DRAFT_201795382 [Suillus brevipes Sb2]